MSGTRYTECAVFKKWVDFGACGTELRIDIESLRRNAAIELSKRKGLHLEKHIKSTMLSDQIIELVGLEEWRDLLDEYISKDRELIVEKVRAEFLTYISNVKQYRKINGMGDDKEIIEAGILAGDYKINFYYVFKKHEDFLD